MEAILAGLSHPIAGPLYALLGGVLTSATPCALAALPLVFGHMSGSTKKTRASDLLLFIVGMAASLTFAGVVAGAAGKALMLSAPWIRWVAGIAFIVGGAGYLGAFSRGTTCSVPLAGGSLIADDGRHGDHVDDLNGNSGSHDDYDGRRGLGASNSTQPGTRSTSLRRSLPRPLAGVSMGVLYGLSASPCSTPALIAILTIVATTGSVGRGAILLLFYSLGQSVLVAFAGLATSAFQEVIGSAKGMRAIEILRWVGGAAITAFGIYILARPYL